MLTKELTTEAFLEGFINWERSRSIDYPIKLERMLALLSSLGDPQKSFKIILVAGSEGKGSTAAMLESILRESGLKTGLFTSPHLVTWHERIRFDGIDIPEDLAKDCALQIESVLAQKDLPYGRPTYFEVLTALALVYFKFCKADAAILEAGLGGEFDSTNATEPSLCVITRIAYEHTDVLGPDLSDIVAAKCGILRKGVPVVVAKQEDYAMSLIEASVIQKDALYVSVSKTLNIIEEGCLYDEERFRIRGFGKERGPFKLGLTGQHQIENAATAFLAAETFFKLKNGSLSDKSISLGFQKVRWPGRFECISRNPVVILDGAHNFESSTVLYETLKRRHEGKKIRLILAMLKDKDPLELLSPIKDLVERVWTTQVNSPRSFSSEELAEFVLKTGLPVRAVSSPSEALYEAKDGIHRNSLVLATGSLYLVGQIKSHIANLT